MYATTICQTLMHFLYLESLKSINPFVRTNNLITGEKLQSHCTLYISKQINTSNLFSIWIRPWTALKASYTKPTHINGLNILSNLKIDF